MKSTGTLILLLLGIMVTTINGAKFQLNADKCVDLGCGFGTLLNGAIPKEMDDVTVYTTNPAKQALVVLSQSLRIHSLNVSSGVLRIDSGSNLDVTTDVYVGPLGTLSIAAPVTINNLLNIGGSMLIDDGALVVNGLTNCIGSIILNAGSLETVGLQIPSTATPPVILGGVLKVTGTANFEVPLEIKGDAQLVIGSGTTTMSKGFQCLDKASTVVTLATLNLNGPALSTINTIAIGPKAIINIDSPCNIVNGLVTNDGWSSINIDNNAILSLSGKSHCGNITLAEGAKLILKSGTFSTVALTSHPNSTIEVGESATLNTQGNLEIASALSLSDTGKLLIESGTVVITGTISDLAGSVIEIGRKGVCRLPANSILSLLSTINLDEEAKLDIAGTTTLLGNVVCPASSKIALIDSAILTLGGATNSILSDIELVANSQLNIASGSKCTIDSITQTSDTSLLFIDTNASLAIKKACILIAQLKINGDAIFTASGVVNITGGIASVPIKSSYPSITLDAAEANFAGDINQIYSITATASKIVVAPKPGKIGRLQVDDKSTLKISGDLTLNGAETSVGCPITLSGAILIDAIADLRGGMQADANSTIKLATDAVVSIGGSSQFDNLLPVTMSGASKLNIASSKCIFSHGLQALNEAGSISFTGDSLIKLFGNTTINSPILCGAKSVLEIPTNGYILINGGLTSLAEASLKLSGATCVLSGISNLAGSVLLDGGSNLITNGACKLSSGVQSLSQDANNILVNTGSCALSAASKISGSVGVRTEANLSVDAPLKCLGGIKNAGVINIGSAVDLTGAILSQTASNAVCQLSSGAQITADAVSIASGKLEGAGKIITTAGCTCGGLVDGAFDITGDLKLLDTAVLIVEVNSVSNFSQILVSNTADIAGLVDVNIAPTAGLKVGDTLTILNAKQCNGKLSLSDTVVSKAFELIPAGTRHNLVYQTPPKDSGKDVSTTGSMSSALIASTPLIALLSTLIILLL
eukprot:gene1514-1766_t